MESSQGNPFKGLQPYTQQDQQKLFGREKDLVLIKDRIYSSRVTLLFAGSGVGKTSFLNAKVIPEFRQQFSVFYHNEWAGKDKPLDAVKKELVRQFTLDKSLSKRHMSEILAGFRKAAGEPGAFAPEQFKAEAPHRCLLILDQFEEVFQYHSYEVYFEQFLDELCEAINDSHLQLRVVFSMREEFLGELSVFDNRIPDLFNNYYRLKYPDKAEAKDIIAQTCDLVHIKVDEGRMGRLVRDLSKVEKTAASYTEYSHDEDIQRTRMIERSFIVPPYLQIACQRLWNKQFATPKNGGAALAAFLEGYRENDAQRVLQDFCTEKLNKLNFIERIIAARAFNFLVTKQGAKMAYESKRLSQHMRVGEKRLKRTLEKLSKPDTRILRFSRGPDGSHWFELYHDMYGTIVDKWKQGFQRTLMRWTFWTSAGATLLASLAVFLLLAIPYWIIKPRQYKEVIQTSDGSNYGVAQEAYYNLRGTYGYATSADAMWAQFWERRAVEAQRTEKRDDALIFSLKALALEPDSETAQRRRVDAGLLVGDDRDSLLFTYRQAGLFPTATFSADGKYVLTQTYVNRGAMVRVWKTGTDRPVSFSADGELFSGQDTGGKPFVEQAAPVKLEIPQRKAVPSKEPVEDSGERDFEARIVVRAAVATLQHRLLIAGTRQNPRTSQEEVLVWSADSGKIYPDLMRQWCKPASNLTVAFSPDSRYIATASSGTINIWKLDAVSNQPMFTKSQPGQVNSLAFSPDGSTLLSAGKSGRVYLWDIDKGKLRGASTTAAGSISKVTFSPEGSAFLTQHEDGSFQVWETTTVSPTGQRMETGYFALTARLSRDNKTVTTLLSPHRQSEGTEYYERIYQRSRMSRTLYQDDNSGDALNSAAYLDRQTAGGIIQVWDSKTGKLLDQNIVSVKNQSDNPFSPDEESLLITVKGGAQLLKLPLQNGHQENTASTAVGFLLFASNRKTLIFYSDAGVYQLLDVQTGRALGPPRQFKTADGTRVSMYGNIIALCEGNTVRVTEFGSDKLLASLPHSRPVKDTAFSRDGKTLVSLDSERFLHFWDTSSFTKKAQSVEQDQESPGIYGFSPSGKYLLTYSIKTGLNFSIWDVTSARRINLEKSTEQDDSRFSLAFAFSEDDGLYAFSDHNNTRIWELPSGKLLNTIPVDVQQLALSNDGKRLLVVERINMIRMWDVETAAPLAPAIDNLSPELFYYDDRGLIFSPDQKSALIFTQSWVHLYAVRDGSLIYKSSRLIGRPYTSYLLLDETGQNIRLAFLSFEGNPMFKDVRFNAPDPANVLVGEPMLLLIEWQNKLSLELDSQGKLMPRWQKRE